MIMKHDDDGHFHEKYCSKKGKSDDNSGVLLKVQVSILQVV